MKITLKQAFKFLEDCSAIITEEHVVVYPSLADLEGGDENEFLYIGWSEEGQEFNAKFREGENRQVEINGSLMTLIDDEGEEFFITLLRSWNLEREAII